MGLSALPPRQLLYSVLQYFRSAMGRSCPLSRSAGSRRRALQGSGTADGCRAGSWRGSSSEPQPNQCLPTYPLIWERKVLPNALPWKGCQALPRSTLCAREMLLSEACLLCGVGTGSERPKQEDFLSWKVSQHTGCV